MALMQWNSSFSVGIKLFDEQHKQLMVLLNSLHDAMKAGKSKEALGQILDGLIEYTVTHFGAEEKAMTEHEFPGYNEHKAEHVKLTDQALKLQKDFKSGKSGVNMDVLNFLKSWLNDHINGSDKGYTAFLNSKGVR